MGLCGQWLLAMVLMVMTSAAANAMPVEENAAAAHSAASRSAVCAPSGDPLVGRVRPRDFLAELLVEVGRARSITFDRLVLALDRSDVVVYIDVESGPDSGPSGKLQFVTSGGGLRYVVATVRPSGRSRALMLADQQQLVAILAHELQHAAEIAATVSVIDDATFADLYRHIGTEIQSNVFDTQAARAAGEQVLAELRTHRAVPDTACAPPAP